MCVLQCLVCVKSGKSCLINHDQCWCSNTHSSLFTCFCVCVCVGGEVHGQKCLIWTVWNGLKAVGLSNGKGRGRERYGKRDMERVCVCVWLLCSSQ